MKRRIFLVLILGILIFGYGGGVSYAASYVFTNNDMHILNHSKAYLWGINQTLGTEEEITSASIVFNDMKNWRTEENYIYVSLYNSYASPGVTPYTDYTSGFEDYFKDTGTGLFTWIGTTVAQDYTYDFDSDEITKLNQALQDGNVGFGVDPDCYFRNNGITFQFDTTVVPEPATMALFGLGLFGFGAARRRRTRK